MRNQKKRRTFYEEKKTDMIIGLVDYPEDLCIPGGFYRLDFLSMIITGAGTASLGHPTLCNGANLAIRREVYLNYSDRIRPEIPSGDDIFLLHSLKKSPYNEIKILKNREALIKTDLPGSLHEFLSQRIRWASKSKYYYDRLTIFLGIIVILMNMCLLSGAVSFLTGITGINLLLIGLVVKIIADSLLLGAGLGFFKGRILLILLPIVEILYPFYILYVLIASSLNHYTWKKREY